MGRTEHRDRRGERGMAIVMVLGVVAVVMLMVVHVMTICELASRDSYATASRTELRYRAESAADQAFWLHATDRRMFTSRRLGEDDVSRDGYDLEPWMADRRGHRMFDSNCYAYIGTVEKSLRVSDVESFKADVDVDDTVQNEIVDAFLDALDDYADSDDNVRLYGKEYDGYAEDGYFSMPRNGDLQYAEEIYWIDGWEDAVKSEITIIPPSGKSIAETSKTSFFSASETEIQNALGLSDDELQTVVAARELWISDGTPLEDSLSSDVYANIMMKFGFEESNLAEYTVSSASDNGEMRVVYTVVREVNFSKKSIFADSEKQSLSIWKRVTY